MCGLFIGVLWHSIVIIKCKEEQDHLSYIETGKFTHYGNRGRNWTLSAENVENKNIQLFRGCMRARKIANQKDSNSISETTPNIKSDQQRITSENWLTKGVASWPGCVSKFKVSASPVVRWCCVQFENRPCLRYEYVCFWAQICWNFDVKVQEIFIKVSCPATDAAVEREKVCIVIEETRLRVLPMHECPAAVDAVPILSIQP